MVQRYTRFYDLPFEAMMQIYREGNQENGSLLYPGDSPARQLARAEEDFREYLTQVFFRQEQAQYYIFVSEGTPVSALRLEAYQDGLLIEALETMPQMRNKGFAKALLTQVSREHAGEKLYSHIRRRNLPSRKTHLACGFRKQLDYAVYIDGTVDGNTDTYLRTPAEPQPGAD